MIDSLLSFHFIRPYWLLMLLPIFLLALKLRKQTMADSSLAAHIHNKLRPYLVKQSGDKQSKKPLSILLALWVIACLALAGPSWQRLAVPVYQSQSALMIVLDLSPSMMAEDIKPNRIRRAQLKIQELLERRKEGLSALLVYAGEAHIVTPFTSDTATIINLLPSLQPGLLPIPGSNIEMAIDLATQQLDFNGLNQATLLLVTDGVEESATSAVKDKLDSRFRLLLMGIGTPAGGTIPTSSGYLKNSAGDYIIASREDATLEKLAKSNQGYYLPLQTDDSDIQFIEDLIQGDFLNNNQKNKAVDRRNYDQWHEFGHLLVILLLPFAALAFRRGWLLSIFFIGGFSGLLLPEKAQASFWQDLWQTKDQQAQQAWDQQSYEEAAELFKNNQWQGSAHYKNENFEKALQSFAQGESATDHYNRGNSLAKLGRFEEAIKAYEDAINKKNDFTQAHENKKAIEDFLKNQQQQNQENQKQDSQDSSQENSEENQQPEQSQADNQNQDNRSEQGNEQKDKQSQEQKNSDEQEKNSGDESERDKEKEKPSEEENTNIAQNEALSEEQQQAMEQWLRKIPDDPSGLLRRKFEYEFNKRRQLYQQGKWELPENNAHKRY